MGYTGGRTPDPTYHDLGDHTEALQLDFDPTVVDYEAILAHVWSAHDPTQTRGSRQRGKQQYRAVVWVHDEAQRAIATRTGVASAQARGGTLATPIEAAGPFYRAEDYHQKYRLRTDDLLLRELRQRFGSDRGMVDATVSARVNGWLAGWGRRRDMEEALPTMGLSPAAMKRLLARGP